MDRKFDLQARVLVTAIDTVGPYTGEVPQVLDPFRFVVIAVAVWMNQQQRQTIVYLCEENRVLLQQLGGCRLLINDGQRRRLAAKANGLRRNLLAVIASI